LQIIHRFHFSGGVGPVGQLLEASDGYLYGGALGGGIAGGICGIYGCGTLYRMGPDGEFQTMHRFTGDDGADPGDGLVESADGALYGVSQGGGQFRSGTFFRVTPARAVAEP
jgi:uncharacterized repeat protein (TIGR03803 family)